jgi:hypothetical protein
VGSECNWYEHLGRVNAHEGDAFTLAMDPLSTFVISGGFDCSVSILDLATLTVIRRYKEHQASITKVGCNRFAALAPSLPHLFSSLPHPLPFPPPQNWQPDLLSLSGWFREILGYPFWSSQLPPPLPHTSTHPTARNLHQVTAPPEPHHSRR